MILKWRQIRKEESKWKDYLICYSADEPGQFLPHSQALKEAKRRLKDEKTIRIIIEKGDL